MTCKDGAGVTMGDDRTRNVVLLVARVLLAASFMPQAIAHTTNISGLAFALSQKGLPYTDALAALIVLAEMFCPAALLIGVAPRLAPAALLAAVVLINGTLHRFWTFSGAARQMEQTIFTAQLGIAAALLFALVAGPGAWSVQGWRADSGASKLPAKKKASRQRASKPKPPAPRQQDEDEFEDAA
jgi:putative oxidoreductase